MDLTHSATPLACLREARAGNPVLIGEPGGLDLAEQIGPAQEMRRRDGIETRSHQTSKPAGRRQVGALTGWRRDAVSWRGRSCLACLPVRQTGKGVPRFCPQAVASDPRKHPPIRCLHVKKPAFFKSGFQAHFPDCGRVLLSTVLSFYVESADMAFVCNEIFEVLRKNLRKSAKSVDENRLSGGKGWWSALKNPRNQRPE